MICSCKIVSIFVAIMTFFALNSHLLFYRVAQPLVWKQVWETLFLTTSQPVGHSTAPTWALNPRVLFIASDCV